MLGAVSINSWSKKTTFCEKTSFLCQVLDFEGIINKFFGLKNDNLIKNVTKVRAGMPSAKIRGGENDL